MKTEFSKTRNTIISNIKIFSITLVLILFAFITIMPSKLISENLTEIKLPNLSFFKTTINEQFSQHLIYPILSILFILSNIFLITLFYYKTKNKKALNLKYIKSNSILFCIWYLFEAFLSIIIFDIIIRYNINIQKLNIPQSAYIATIIIISFFVLLAYFIIFFAHNYKNNKSKDVFISKNIFSTIILFVFILKASAGNDYLNFNYIFSSILQATVFNIFMMILFYIFYLIITSYAFSKITFFRLWYVIVAPIFLSVLLIITLVLLFEIFNFIFSLHWQHSSNSLAPLLIFMITIVDSIMNFLKITSWRDIILTIIEITSIIPLIKIFFKMATKNNEIKFSHFLNGIAILGILIVIVVIFSLI